VLHISKDDEKESSTTFELTVLFFEFFFFSYADNRIKEPPQGGDKLFVGIICAPLVLLFPSSLLN
jgi:hypothetical protein